jgi:hypothetical protein
MTAHKHASLMRRKTLRAEAYYFPALALASILA